MTEQHPLVVLTTPITNIDFTFEEEDYSESEVEAEETSALLELIEYFSMVENDD